MVVVTSPDTVVVEVVLPCRIKVNSPAGFNPTISIKDLTATVDLPQSRPSLSRWTDSFSDTCLPGPTKSRVYSVASLCVTAIWPVRSDGHMGHHSYDGNSEWDLVIVCRRCTETEPCDLDLTVDK